MQTAFCDEDQRSGGGEKMCNHVRSASARKANVLIVDKFNKLIILSIRKSGQLLFPGFTMMESSAVPAAASASVSTSVCARNEAAASSVLVLM